MASAKVDHPAKPWLLVLLFAAAWPIVVNVALVELASAVSVPLAKTVLGTGILSDHASFTGAMRILNGALFALLLSIVFGVPLGLVAGRRVGLFWSVFVVGVLSSSAIWSLYGQWGIAGFLNEWSLPELWIALICIGVVAMLVGYSRTSRKQEHAVAP